VNSDHNAESKRANIYKRMRASLELQMTQIELQKSQITAQLRDIELLELLNHEALNK
jgi:hypothetical protein